MGDDAFRKVEGDKCIVVGLRAWTTYAYLCIDALWLAEQVERLVDDVAPQVIELSTRLPWIGALFPTILWLRTIALEA